MGSPRFAGLHRGDDEQVAIGRIQMFDYFGEGTGPVFDVSLRLHSCPCVPKSRGPCKMVRWLASTTGAEDSKAVYDGGVICVAAGLAYIRDLFAIGRLES